ncbi:MAG: class I SAM-dependent methyltransferase [archaeon]|nr:class I SAM-dependent methyltransferase [archaeon]
MYSKLRIDQVLNEMIMGLSKGKMLLGDSEILYEVSKEKKIIVEIGTSRGFAAMIMSLHGAEVYTIDNYLVIDDEASSSLLDKENSQEIRSTVAKYLSLFGRIIQVYGESLKIAENHFEQESVDLLYIDAEHTYLAVKSDFFAWFPKVRKGGFILFHDYSNLHPGIKEFVDGIAGFNEIEEIVVPTLGQTVIKIFRKKL